MNIEETIIPVPPEEEINSQIELLQVQVNYLISIATLMSRTIQKNASFMPSDQITMMELLNSSLNHGVVDITFAYNMIKKANRKNE